MDEKVYIDLLMHLLKLRGQVESNNWTKTYTNLFSLCVQCDTNL